MKRNDSSRTLAWLLTSVERIGQGEDHEVVALVGVGQEGAAVVDVSGDALAVVGPVRVPLDADGLDARVDLDRIDVPRAPLEGQGHIRAASRADDQHLVERPPREPLVDLLVEGLPAGRAQRMEGLVRDAVDPDALLAVREAHQSDAVVRGVGVVARLHGPEGAVDEEEDGQQCRDADQRPCGEPRTELHEEHEEDGHAEPDERVGARGAERHEEGDATERADDVDGVGP